MESRGREETRRASRWRAPLEVGTDHPAERARKPANASLVGGKHAEDKKQQMMEHTGKKHAKINAQCRLQRRA